ncbi:MAG: hypothetical protein WC343_00815 [Bacilli bacterium]|jgi:hypothetical protein
MTLAILGAIFTSGASANFRGLGFLLWIFSNGFLAIQFYRGKDIPMFMMFLFYELMNMRGVYNNLLV